MPILPFNRSLFYRTSAFWDEPRFEKPYLTTLEIQPLGGSNHRGRDGCHLRTNVLGIYGPENIADLRAASKILCTVPPFLQLPNNPEAICFQAVADVFEMDINFYQNFNCGFFAHFHLPVVLVQIYPSGYVANCCCQHEASKHYRPVWENSFTPLCQFLKCFNIDLSYRHETGLSDSTLFLGWTKNYGDTERLDFIDYILKTGILFPTGRKKNIHELFDIPFGYNGHWGIPWSGDISLGYFDWFTIGLHADGVFFFPRTQCIRFKAPCQAPTGLIRLQEGQAEVHAGPVWRLGTYLKADHFFNGLSLMLAFSYEQKNANHIENYQSPYLSYDFINNDEQLKKWDRSMIHLLAEYDFMTEYLWAAPRIGIFYDKQLTGKRVWEINTVGGYLGIDLNWCY